MRSKKSLLTQNLSEIYVLSKRSALFKILSKYLTNALSSPKKLCKDTFNCLIFLVLILSIKYPLLVIFTLVSIYEPILNVINRKISHNDIIVLIVMGIALAISSFFIIRKEKS